MSLFVVVASGLQVSFARPRFRLARNLLVDGIIIGGDARWVTVNSAENIAYLSGIAVGCRKTSPEPVIGAILASEA